jgi:hypothetical protein
VKTIVLIDSSAMILMFAGLLISAIRRRVGKTSVFIPVGPPPVNNTRRSRKFWAGIVLILATLAFACYYEPEYPVSGVHLRDFVLGWTRHIGASTSFQHRGLTAWLVLIAFVAAVTTLAVSTKYHLPKIRDRITPDLAIGIAAVTLCALVAALYALGLFGTVLVYIGGLAGILIYAARLWADIPRLFVGVLLWLLRRFRFIPLALTASFHWVSAAYGRIPRLLGSAADSLDESNAKPATGIEERLLAYLKRQEDKEK